MKGLSFVACLLYVLSVTAFAQTGLVTGESAQCFKRGGEFGQGDVKFFNVFLPSMLFGWFGFGHVLLTETPLSVEVLEKAAELSEACQMAFLQGYAAKKKESRLIYSGLGAVVNTVIVILAISAYDLNKRLNDSRRDPCAGLPPSYCKPIRS